MLIAALLLVFTLLCFLLNADGAWDNETKAERNELVFDGRHRAYGAFILRREYDRRFILAFAGALGVMGSAVLLPKALALMGLNMPQPPVIHTAPWIDVVLHDTPVDLPKADPQPAPKPLKSAAPPSAPIIPSGPVVVAPDPVPAPDPQPTPTPDPVPPGNGGDPKPGPDPDPERGTMGSPLGRRDNPRGAADVDSLPEFIGGQRAMQRFVQDNIRFDNYDGARQKEWVEFVVDVDGSVVDVHAKGMANAEFGQAATRVVKQMPKWKPAIRKGDKVACILVLPINFQTK